jgi:chromosome partitioning protein
MILIIGNTKGGVGKTTLAVNLAIIRAREGRDVLLVDGDEQRTAMSFTELRNGALHEAGYTAVALQGGAVRSEVRKLAPKYDDVIIDVGGRDTGALRAALTVGERVLVPIQPRSFDVWSIEGMAELVSEAREINPSLDAMSMLNAADVQGRDNDDAAAVLQETAAIRFVAATLVRRKAFPNAAAAGKGVVEFTPRDRKAVTELTALAKAAFA